MDFVNPRCNLHASRHHHDWQRRLADEMIAHFADPGEASGFFNTRDDHDSLIIRPKELRDNAMAALALLQLSIYSGNKRYHHLAESILSTIWPTAENHPTALAFWLRARDFALSEVQEVVILGDLKATDSQALINVIWETYRPHLMAALINGNPTPSDPPLASERVSIKHQEIAYVCQHSTCKQPVSNPHALREQLTAKRI